MIDFRNRVFTCACIAGLAAGCTEPPTDSDSPPPGGLPGEGERGIGHIRTSHGVEEIPYVVFNGIPIADGDIELRPDMVGSALFAAPAGDGFLNTIYHWDNNVVPFVIQPGHPSEQAILGAIARLQRRTAVRFVPKTSSSPNWIEFVNESIPGCGLSEIGRGWLGAGRQLIRIDGACASPGLVLHEIDHALGYLHEHQRADRRFHIDIHDENIEDGQGHNFEVRNVNEDLAPGPYDFGSIMHYSSTAFGKTDPATGQTLTTISRLDGQPLVTQQNALSDGDLRSLNSIYPPPDTERPHMCRTAPPRNGRTRRRVDLAEVWQDIGPTTSLAVHRSLGTSFATPVDFALRAGGFAIRIRWSAGDFDGDGDQDLMAVWNDGGSNTLTVWRSNGSTFTSTHWGQKMGGWLDTTQWLPGDFNNDGITDMAAVWKDGTGSTPTTISVYLSNGVRFDGWMHFAWRAGGWNPETKWNVGDFNNDGRDDLVAAWPDGTGARLTVWRATSDSHFVAEHWMPKHGGWANNIQWLAGNFDGAPGTDVMAVWKESDNTATFTLYRANPAASRFETPTQTPWASHDGGWDDRFRYTAGDVDADGRDDVIAAWNQEGMSTLTVRRSGGLTSLDHVHWAQRTNGWQNQGSWCAGSFDAN